MEALFCAIDELLPDDTEVVHSDEQGIRALLDIMTARIPRTGKFHDQKMWEFDQTAKVFNRQLEYAQSCGLRLSEKPTTLAAIQRLAAKQNQK